MYKLVFLFVCFHIYSGGANANQECEPLAPSNAQDVEESFKGELEGKLDGVVGKIVGGGASLNGEYKTLSTDTLKDYPDSHKLYVWQRMIYLVCVRPDAANLDDLFEAWLNGPPDVNAVESMLRYKCVPAKDDKLMVNVIESGKKRILTKAEAKSLAKEFTPLNIRSLSGEFYISNNNGFFKRTASGRYRHLSTIAEDEHNEFREGFKKSRIYANNLMVWIYDKNDLLAGEKKVARGSAEYNIEIAIFLDLNLDMQYRVLVELKNKENGKDAIIALSQVFSACVSV